MRRGCRTKREGRHDPSSLCFGRSPACQQAPWAIRAGGFAATRGATAARVRPESLLSTVRVSQHGLGQSLGLTSKPSETPLFCFVLFLRVYYLRNFPYLFKEFHFTAL